MGEMGDGREMVQKQKSVGEQEDRWMKAGLVSNEQSMEIK